MVIESGNGGIYLTRMTHPATVVPKTASPTAGANPPIPPKGGFAPMRRLADLLFRPVDPASLAIFRIAFGLLMLWEILRHFQLGRIAPYYLIPECHFPYFGFDWLRPLPGRGMYLLFGSLAALACTIAAGFLYRLSAILFFLGYTYAFLLEQSNFQNHLYLFCLLGFLLSLTSPHRALSLDAILFRRRVKASVPAWHLHAFRFQIGLVYFMAGVAKMNLEWLSLRPMRENLRGAGTLPLIGDLLHHDIAIALLTYGGLGIDLLCVFFLMGKRTRTPAVLALAAFNLINSRLFSIGVFPWFMLAAISLFYPPDWPRKLFSRLLRPLPTQSFPERRPREGTRRLVLSGLAAYACLQIALPFRHLLIDGRRDWTMEGYLFSWTMKLNVSKGRFYVIARDEATGRQWHINPLLFITAKQSEKMAYQPDMMIQFSRFAKKIVDDQEKADVGIFWRSELSLNGRPYQPFIDSSVDLARQRRILGHQPWILGGPGT
jgi:vitamin K-dependent gamma-carboxylase